MGLYKSEVKGNKVGMCIHQVDGKLHRERHRHVELGLFITVMTLLKGSLLPWDVSADIFHRATSDDCMARLNMRF